MVSNETIQSILALNISDSDKASLISKLVSEAPAENTLEPVVAQPVEKEEEAKPIDPNVDFLPIKFRVFDQEFHIIGREENPHPASDAQWMYWVRICRKGQKPGKALFFDETDKFGKRGWLFFDPDTNPRITDRKVWAKYYSRVNDCCRYLLLGYQTDATLDDVINGRVTSKTDFKKTGGWDPFEDPHKPQIDVNNQELPFV